MSDVYGERGAGRCSPLGRWLRDGVRIDDRTRGSLGSAKRVVHEVGLARAGLVVG
jgi:hypothetical protein